MCGIAGGVNLSPDQLSSMLSALQHRGPDGTGNHHGINFSLGMTRLAILDPENGLQPFSLGSIYSICNGEIYNWEELRSDLEEKGYKFRTRCDSEILPAAWLEWGTDLPSKLNGMFALAILDSGKDTLFLARDRCGQKPLYLTSPNSGPIRFASEIKALAAIGFPLTPDLTHLSTWLQLRYLPEPVTLFHNVETLPAAHWTLIQKDGSRQTTRYWKPDPSPYSRRQNPPVLQVLDDLARSSVELALQSDVPVAAYLSGGVDSALLGHYLRDLGQSPKTVSLGFGAASDETSAAQDTAHHLGLDHHPVQLTPSSLSDLPGVVSQMDLPIGDALILAFDKLASHTASLGAKVALGGEGPDEHFAGYSFQKSYLTARRLREPGRRLAATALALTPKALIQKLASFPAQLGPEGRAKITSYLHQFSSLTPHQQITGLHSIFSPTEAQSLLHPDLLSSQVSPAQPKIQNLPDLLATQYSSWLPDWSLIRQDRNSMAHSLEYRAPFLDHRLIEFAFTLSDSQKLSRGRDKFIWRTLASRHLPKSITHRPKQPFYLPLESPSWQKPFLTLAHDLLAPQGFTCHGLLNPNKVRPLLEAATFLPLKQLAAIVILQLWLDQNPLS